MPLRTGSITVEVPPANAMTILLGTGFKDMVQPDFSQHRLLYTGDDIMYLMSLSGAMHDAVVSVEAWTDMPDRADDGPWEETDEAPLRLSEGRIYVAGMLEGRFGPTLDVGPPGTYRARVHARGRQKVQRLEQQPDLDPEDFPAGVERFLVQLWPLSP